MNRRRLVGHLFGALCLGATLLVLLVLSVLLFDVLHDGWPYLRGHLLTGHASRFAAQSGVRPALMGTLWTIAITAVCAFPLGIGTALWLEEYAPNTRFTRVIATNIANLAGVPAVVYGLLGLALFVRMAGLGASVLAGGLTLAMLVLPVIIIAAQEAIRAVPPSIRLGAYALGATRWEAVRHHVLPQALPGILTGTILAASRAIGEAAPLILVGAFAFVTFSPRSPLDDFTVLPVQIFSWISKPQAEFHALAAAASIVLLVVLLGLNAAAIIVRGRLRRGY